MVLDKIKTDTTWNDASASINGNFSKLKQAIALGSLGNAVMLDTEMADESESAVQNKVIKQYVDEKTATVMQMLETMEKRVMDLEQATILPLYEKQ